MIAPPYLEFDSDAESTRNVYDCGDETPALALTHAITEIRRISTLMRKILLTQERIMEKLVDPGPGRRTFSFHWRMRSLEGVCPTSSRLRERGNLSAVIRRRGSGTRRACSSSPRRSSACLPARGMPSRALSAGATNQACRGDSTCLHGLSLSSLWIGSRPCLSRRCYKKPT